jgi:predicted aconitase
LPVIPKHEVLKIIQSSFLPLQCTCTPHEGGTMTIEVTDPAANGHIDLLVVGVPLAPLTNIRAISNLVAELRQELQANQEWFAREPQQKAWPRR